MVTVSESVIDWALYEEVVILEWAHYKKSADLDCV